jgi:hypothetical protein
VKKTPLSANESGRRAVKKALATALYASGALNFFPDLVIETKLHAGTKIRSPIDLTGLSRTEK